MMKYIKFKVCYLLLILIPITVVIFMALFATKIVTIDTCKKPEFFIVEAIVALFFGLYINLGFVKIADILKIDILRKIMITIIAFMLINLCLSFLTRVLGYHIPYSFYLIVGSLISLLCFFGFRLVKDSEFNIFQRLSKLNLYSFIFELIYLLSIVFGKHLLFLKALGGLSLIPQIIIYILIWYWEIVLFRKLYVKFEKDPMLPNIT